MRISVITATYNRRELLSRVFESLVEQQYDSIEWIVVDDGGSDRTGELISAFQKSAKFVIRYMWQTNAGKARAVNRGMDTATGELVCVVDDDDYFLPDVFRHVAEDYAEIADRDKVAALSYLTVDPGARVWGSRFPEERMISDHYECRINGRVWGDKCEFTKTKVLRDGSLRYFEGETRGGIGGDALFFFAVAAHYDTYYVNRPVLVKDYQADGISVNWRNKALQNTQLTTQYYAGYLNGRIRPSIRLRYMVAYVAIARFAGRRVHFSDMQSVSNRMLFCLSYLPGTALGWRWKLYKGGAIPQTTKWMCAKS
jgi:glycosyltransferase involved in cell wall biosynthesis